MNKRVQALIKKYKGKVMTYRKLPEPAQLAVLQNMAVDDNHWYPSPDMETVTVEDDVPDYVEQYGKLPYYVEKYGKAKFGLVVVPTDELAQIVFASARKGNGFRFKTFEGYHRGYLRKEAVPDHGDSVWPMILGDRPTEAIRDGLLRFHSYVRRGLKDIPCLYYLPDSWKKPIPKHCHHGICIATLGYGHCECPCQDCDDAGIYYG